MKKSLTAALCFLFSVFLSGRAQEYSSSFNAVRLPVSVHVAALGGVNNTLVEDTPAAGWANPALYANVSGKSAGLDFMTYAGGSSWMGAQYVHAFGERHTAALAMQYMNYGKMDETDAEGRVLGEFAPKDIVINCGYSYLFSDRWTGGAALKMIYSKLADYSSVAFAVDLGLNYFDEEQDLSASLSVQNIGTQVKAYDDGMKTHLPFTLTLGFSKGFDHLPVRIHAAFTDVTRWKSDYYALPDADSKKVKFGSKLLNHFAVGLDILPTNYLYIAAGYNFRRAYELKASGSSKLAGLSFGAGIDLKGFKFGLSYARYHLAASSIMGSLAYSFK